MLVCEDKTTLIQQDGERKKAAHEAVVWDI
jgi:hypothetical protein